MALTIEGLEKWYVNTVKLKHGFAGTTPPDPIPLPAVTNIDGLLEGLAEETENLFVAAADYSGRHHTEDLAYKLQLPDKIYRWNGMRAVGGRTILFNQMFDTFSLPSLHGLTASLTDGLFSVSGTPDANVQFIFINNFQVYSGHKYLFNVAHRKAETQSAVKIYDISGAKLLYNDASAKTGYESFTASGDTLIRYYVQVDKNKTADMDIYPQLFDLTKMFGAGNEPSVDEFKEMFPLVHYDYNAGELIDAKVTSIVSADSDGNVIDTVDVPAGVQALTGYGYSTPGKCNYIDFKNKKFVQNVGRRAYASGDESDSTVITDGTNTNYDLTTPVETSITLPDTDIEHEAGGSITFENTNKIPVPVNVDYIGV